MLHNFKLTLSPLAIVAIVIFGIFYTQPSNAQSPTTAMCNETQSITIDPTQFAGTWYEQARNPALATPFGCVQVNFTVETSNNTMDIATTYTDTPLYPWVNQTMTANVKLTSDSDSDASTSGYNFSYLLPQHTYTPYALYKILHVDYDNYTFICGYTNQTDNSTSFGILLTRVQLFNYSLTDLGYQGYPNFPDNDDWFLSPITQSETCYLSSALMSTVSPMYGIIFAIFYTALLA